MTGGEDTVGRTRSGVEHLAFGRSVRSPCPWLRTFFLRHFVGLLNNLPHATNNSQFRDMDSEVLHISYNTMTNSSFDSSHSRKFGEVDEIHLPATVLERDVHGHRRKPISTMWHRHALRGMRHN